MTSYAVIIGRFQVADLHAGHRYLIDTAIESHDQLLIILGVTGGEATTRNPLDVKTREQMIKRRYPNAIIKTLNDQASDELWSKQLDVLIYETAGKEATIYGSRNCFAEHYHGTYEVKLLKEIPMISGERTRRGVADKPLDNAIFRQGMIYAQQIRFPASYQTVDIVVYRKETGEILLGRKEDETTWRFIGGFVDPTDESLEFAAKRECYEESGGIEIDLPRYIGSTRINDHRYRNSTDGIMTAICIAQYIFGAPRASDDLAELKWVHIEDLEAQLAPNHQIIWKKAADTIRQAIAP